MNWIEYFWLWFSTFSIVQQLLIDQEAFYVSDVVLGRDEQGVMIVNKTFMFLTFLKVKLIPSCIINAYMCVLVLLGCYNKNIMD